MSRRTKLRVGAVIATLTVGSGQTEIRPVTVHKGGEQYSARVYFNRVNDKAVWGFGEASEEVIEVLNAAMGARGERKMFRVLAEEVS